MTPDDDPLERLIRGDTAVIEVEGGSMLPWLRSGDRVLVVPAHVAQRGDVALVLVDGRWVLHRVVRRDAASVTTRGDFNRGADAGGHGVRVVGIAVDAARPDGRRRWFPRGRVGRAWARVAPVARLGLRAFLVARRRVV